MEFICNSILRNYHIFKRNHHFVEVIQFQSLLVESNFNQKAIVVEINSNYNGITIQIYNHTKPL